MTRETKKEFYAIHVKTGFENTIKRQLENSIHPNFTFNIHVLQRRVIYYKNKSKIIVPQILFPGYILIESEFNMKLMSEIKKINHVFRILGADDTIIPIPEYEINPLLSLMNEQKIIDISYGLKEGDIVKIISGPLAGKESIITKLMPRKYRATVRIDFDGNINTVNLGLDIVSKVNINSTDFTHTFLA